MNNCLRIAARSLLAVSLIAAFSASAQDTLENVLDRGYVMDWLVCGPFPADVPGGIVGAVRQGTPPLGETDHLASMGGVARARPQENIQVDVAGNASSWTTTQTAGYVLDTKDRFAVATEGIMYVAFYAQSQWERLVYFDVQSPLGVRMWLNGFPLRKIRPTPVATAGLDRFVATMKLDRNLIVIEVPLASLEALAQASGSAPKALREQISRTRPMLYDPNGFQIAVRIQPCDMVEGVAYVPRLELTGTYSGRAGSASQDVTLTIFNTRPVPSPPISVITTVSGWPDPIEQAVLPIPPETQKSALLSIPVAGALKGEPVRIQTTLTVDQRSKNFTTQLTLGIPPEQGTVYLLTGAHITPTAAEDQRTRFARRLAEIDRNMVMLANERDYGFGLGDTAAWSAWWHTQAPKRPQLAEAAALARCGPDAGFTLPDERIVTGETLVRNLCYGYYTAQSLLKLRGRCYTAWRAPAICPQTPQLLQRSGNLGILSSLDTQGLDPLFQQCALDGTRLLHRRKAYLEAPASIDQLRKAAHVQRQELLAQGIASDILLNESAVSPPEAFFLGACTGLAHGLPAIRVTGAAGDLFLKDALDAMDNRGAPVVQSTRLMTTSMPGDLASQRDLKSAFARVENLLITTEKLATFASLLGAIYPETALDYAWRQVLFLSHTDRIGFAASPRVYVDSLTVLRDTTVLLEQLLAQTTAFLAGQVNTYRGMPDSREGTQIIVVFNPCSWPRTDACSTNLPIPATGIGLIDDAGQPVPFHIESASQPVTSTSLVTFVARDVPPLGYRTFYATPGGAAPQFTEEEANAIENELFKVAVDPSQGGAILSLVDKRNGKEYAKGPLNDIEAIEEVSALNASGREFWATPGGVRASTAQAEVSKVTSQAMSRLVVKTPFLGGTATREITLFAGAPVIHCRVRLEGCSLQWKTIALSFNTWTDGLTPVYGERFGAIVGRTSLPASSYQTARGANPTGAGIQPALRWAALSPNDAIESGGDRAWPLMPAQIIFNDQGPGRRYAQELQYAFARRGIPCTIARDETPQPEALWTDSTRLDDPDEELRYGANMRILVGGPDGNAMTKRLLTSFFQPDQVDRARRLNESGMLFVEWNLGDAGLGIVPTLVLAGASPADLDATVRTVAQTIAQTGVIHAPTEGCVPETSPPKPSTGLAVLFAGAAQCEYAHDGPFRVILAHENAWANDPDRLALPAVPDPIEFDYAICPFSGTWREAGVPRQAFAFCEPLVAVTTTPHVGSQPTSQSFITCDDPAFIVTAVKPAGYPLADALLDTSSARNGLVVRGFQSTGRARHVTLRSCVPLRAASLRDLLEQERAPLQPQTHELGFDAEGFAVETVMLLPAPGLTGDATDDLDAVLDTRAPRIEEYWQHNAGAAPPGHHAFSLILSGDPANPTAPMTVTAANNLARQTLSGTIQMVAAPGWSVAPVQIDYTLAPGEVVEKTVAILERGAVLPGNGIMARAQHDGYTCVGIASIAGNPFNMTVNWADDEISVTVANTGGLPAEGFVDLAVPPLAWRETRSGASSAVSPHHAPISVPAFDEQRVVFRITGNAPQWAVAKLAANGQILYQRVTPR